MLAGGEVLAQRRRRLLDQKEGPGRTDALDVGGAAVFEHECGSRQITELLADVDATRHAV